MTTIHWESRIVWGLMPPRAVQLWNIYAAMVNNEGVAWPSLTHLSGLMGARKRDVASNARRWLLEHKALEEVTGYVPPSTRNAGATKGKSGHPPMYVRITGRLELDGKEYQLAYFPGHQAGMDEPVTGHQTVKSPNSDQSPNGDQKWSPNSDQYQSPNGDPNVVPENVLPSNLSTATAATRASASGPAEETPEPPPEPVSPMAAVYTAWHNTGALLTGQINDELKDAVQEFGQPFVIAAIEEMGRSGGRNLKYLRSIMDTCRAQNRFPGTPRQQPPKPAAPKPAPVEDPDNWPGKKSNLPRPAPMRSPIPPGWKPKEEAS